MNYLPNDRSDTARLQRALRAPRADAWESHVGEKVTDSGTDPLRRLRRHNLVSEDKRLVEHRERVLGIVTCPDCGSDVELLQDTDAWVELENGDGTIVCVHHGYGPGMGVCCQTLLTDDACDGLRAWDLAKEKEA